MKVTQKLDEAVGLSSTEIREQQAEAKRRREFNRKWLEAEGVVRWAGVNAGLMSVEQALREVGL